MSEPLRIQSSNVLFHVINRGNAKQTIFHDVADREYYLDLLYRYKVRFRVRIYHYVLMDNHVHLLLEPTVDTTISRFLLGLNLSYTKYFNRRYGSVGHVWQGRTRVIPIETETYYVRCAMYIELNPLRARLVRHPRECPWSSYRASALEVPQRWLDVHPLLKTLQIRDKGDLTIYALLIEDEIRRISQAKNAEFSSQEAYGDKEFLAWYAARARPRVEIESRSVSWPETESM